VAGEIKAMSQGRGAGGGSPDFVALLHVSADDAVALAAALGIQDSYRPQHHQRVRRTAVGGGGEGHVGVCLLSKHPLYEGGPLRIDRKQNAGVSAVAVVGATKFRVACIYAGDREGNRLVPLLEQRKAEGRPPMLLVFGEDAGVRQLYRAALLEDFSNVAPGGEASAVSLFVTPQWRVAASGGSTGGLTCYEIGAASDVTAPSSSPAR
jgi:hypothetical protein